jgi:hypothetical protein
MKLVSIIRCSIYVLLPVILGANLSMASCPGTAITVSVSSPSSSGTYSTPTRFTATASSSQGQITGYAVYSDNLVVYENDNTTTLDGWAILPLTSSGGSQSHDVFVRAWDSASNCNDSSHLTITSSGTQIPTALSGSTSFNNVDDDQSGDGGVTAGWGDCGTRTCAGGQNDATVSFSFNQSPSRDSGSIRLDTSGGPWADGLFFYNTGAHNSMTNFVWDFYFQLSSSTTNDAAAIEFDLFQSINGTRWMFGTQCNYSTGNWQAWNDVSQQWVDAIPNTATDGSPSGTAISCSKFSTGTWHHAQFFFQRGHFGTSQMEPNMRILYGNVTIDGVTTQWNITAPSKSTTWSDSMGIQQQLDINSASSVTISEWADLDNIVAWPQN